MPEPIVMKNQNFKGQAQVPPKKGKGTYKGVPLSGKKKSSNMFTSGPKKRPGSAANASASKK